MMSIHAIFVMKKIDIIIRVCVDLKHVLNVLIKLITALNVEIKIYKNV